MRERHQFQNDNILLGWGLENLKIHSLQVHVHVCVYISMYSIDE